MRLDTAARERLMSKISMRPNGCWRWTAATNRRGYGVINVEGAARLAHRVTYHVFRRAVPNDLCVLHHCDNPSCVNPSHLFLGTRADNARDMKRKGRSAYGERNAHSKLTDKQRAEIRARYAAGNITQQALADEHGVTQPLIAYVLKNPRLDALEARI